MWIRIGEIYHDLGQKRPDEEFTYIDVSSIHNERGLITNNLQKLSPESAPSRARKLVKKGTVIYSTVRPYLLNIAIVDKDFYPSPIVSTAFAVMHPFEGIFNKYLYFYLRSKPFIEFVETKMVGMAYPAINDSQLSMGLFPLPPLNEQKRIVTKIERLLKKSQEIEIQLTQADQEIINLNKAALKQLLDAKDADEFQKRWQFILDSFDFLYSEERNISDLKQAILQLAIQGKLVPQDPADEPATELLERIKAEKLQLIQEKKIKKEKPLPPISCDEIPYELPEGWVWVRLHDIYDVRDGTHDTPKYEIKGVPLVTSKNLKNGKVDFSDIRYISVDDHKKISIRSKVEIGDILFAMIGSIGNPVIVEKEDFSIKNVALFKYYDKSLSNPKYLCYFLQMASSDVRRTSLGGVQSFVSLKLLRNYIIPLPPLNEQERIVARVDELMRLCDELEEQIGQSKEESERLMQAVLREAFEEKDVEESNAEMSVA